MLELPFITIVIGVLLFFSLIIGFTRGVKRGFYSLICNIVAIVAAFGITRLIIIVLSKRGIAPIGEKILSNKIFEGAFNIQDYVYLTKFVGTIALSIVLFYALYLLLLLISQKIKRSIFNKVTKVRYSQYKVLLEKKWYMKILAMIISAISCLATCYVLTFGVVAVNSAVVKGFEKENNIKKPYAFTILEKDYTYPIIEKCFAEKMFNALTAMHDKDVKPVTTNEITKGIKLVLAISSIEDENIINNNLDTIEDTINTTEIVPEIVGRMIIDRANEVEIYEPKKNDKGYEARLLRFENECLIFAKSTNSKNVKENLKTAVKLGKLAVSKEAFDITDYEDVIEMAKDEDFTEEVFTELYNNKNTQNIMGYLIDLCVGSVFDDLNVDIKETYIFSLDYSKLSISEVKNEANIISKFANDYEIIHKLAKGESLNEEELAQIKEDLKDIENCEIITNTVYDTINGLVKNEELVIPEPAPAPTV